MLLPDELLRRIAGGLGSRDLPHLCLCSKRINRVCGSMQRARVRWQILRTIIKVCFRMQALSDNQSDTLQTVVAAHTYSTSDLAMHHDVLRGDCFYTVQYRAEQYADQLAMAYHCPQMRSYFNDAQATIQDVPEWLLYLFLATWSIWNDIEAKQPVMILWDQSLLENMARLVNNNDSDDHMSL